MDGMVEAGVEDFEVNEAGKAYNIGDRCFFFSKEIIWFAGSSKYDRIYSSLFDQLLRSATSIGVNIVEGRAGSSKKYWEKLFHNCVKAGK